MDSWVFEHCLMKCRRGLQVFENLEKRIYIMLQHDIILGLTFQIHVDLLLIWGARFFNKNLFYLIMFKWEGQIYLYNRE